MIKKILLAFLMLSTFSFAEVVTKTTVKTAEGVGIGITREEAVNNAIIEALSQINGSYISKTSFATAATVNSTAGNSAAYVYSNKIRKVTKGKVDSFSILDVMDYGDGKFEARVSVKKTKVTKKYRTPGLSPKNRRSVAVVPSYTNKSSYNVLGQFRNAREVSQRMTQELVSSITQTRKFTVLDREANEAYRDEKAILMSRDSTKDELLKLGQVLGADYLLVTNITDLAVQKDSSGSSIVANMSDSYKAYVTVQYRIIAMATRQIKWSNTSNYEFEPSGSTLEQIYLDTLKRVSSNITTELIENIYPIKVVDVTSNQVTINQGSLKIGQEFEVYKLGKKIYDSYTKESLGRTELKVGKIKIVRSLPKMSVGEIIEGEVSKGDICRTLYTSSNASEGNSFNITEADKPSNTRTTEGGGVVLPFD